MLQALLVCVQGGLPTKPLPWSANAHTAALLIEQHALLRAVAQCHCYYDRNDLELSVLFIFLPACGESALSPSWRVSRSACTDPLASC